MQAGGQEFESPHLHQFPYLDNASNSLDESYHDKSGKQLLEAFIVDLDVVVQNSPPHIRLPNIPLVSLDNEYEIEISIIDSGVFDAHVLVVNWGDNSGISVPEVVPEQRTFLLKHTYTLGTEGRPYSIHLSVSDEHGTGGVESFQVDFAETFTLLPRVNDPIAKHFGKKFIQDRIMRRSGINSLTVASVQESALVLINADIGNFLFDLNDYSWKDLAPLDPNLIDTYGAEAIALNDEQIFVLGTIRTRAANWNQAAIYDIPSDSWTYPPCAVTSHRLLFPELTLLESGEVLVLGGEKPGGKVNDLVEIYNPASGTFTVVAENPISEKLRRYRNQTNNRNDFGDIRTAKLSDGRVFVIEVYKGFVAVFDPEDMKFDVMTNVGANDTCPVDPQVFADGSIFIGRSIIRNLTSVEPINLDVDASGNKLCSFDGFNFRVSNQVKLPDDRILFVGGDSERKVENSGQWAPGSWLFDKGGYRLTSYKPQLGRSQPFLFRNREGHVVILGGTDRWSNTITQRELFRP